MATTLIQRARAYLDAQVGDAPYPGTDEAVQQWLDEGGREARGLKAAHQVDLPNSVLADDIRRSAMSPPALDLDRLRAGDAMVLVVGEDGTHYAVTAYRKDQKTLGNYAHTGALEAHAARRLGRELFGRELFVTPPPAAMAAGVPPFTIVEARVVDDEEHEVELTIVWPAMAETTERVSTHLARHLGWEWAVGDALELSLWQDLPRPGTFVSEGEFRQAIRTFCRNKFAPRAVPPEIIPMARDLAHELERDDGRVMPAMPEGITMIVLDDNPASLHNALAEFFGDPLAPHPVDVPDHLNVSDAKLLKRSGVTDPGIPEG